jgi:serine/threonine protein kinase
MSSLVSCLYYNPDGDIETLSFKDDASKTSYPPRFFRKYSTSPNEIEICKRLMSAPHPNVVQIFGVDETQHWIDMECLNVGALPGQCPIADLQDALAHLHSLHCVYIDLKRDNIGYSQTTQTYKLFDFDMSGIVHPTDPTQWLLPPPLGYIYKHLLELHPTPSTPISLPLYHYDTLCLELWKEKGYKG